jgi:DNA-binding response OmpR family regulator
MARILVINEDHQATAVREALASGGYEYHIASSPEEAMSQAHGADLAILPVLVPGQLSLTALHDLRNRFPNLPILVVMGRPPSWQDMHLLELLGATRMIEFPFQPSAFLAMVAASLRLHSHPTASKTQKLPPKRA